MKTRGGAYGMMATAHALSKDTEARRYGWGNEAVYDMPLVLMRSTLSV
jgi:hypothetical protein